FHLKKTNRFNKSPFILCNQKISFLGLHQWYILYQGIAANEDTTGMDSCLTYRSFQVTCQLKRFKQGLIIFHAPTLYFLGKNLLNLILKYVLLPNFLAGLL